MQDALHIDYETYGSIDLKSVGAARYAAAPDTDILMMCIALNDGPVYTWLPSNLQDTNYWEHESDTVEDILSSFSGKVYAHNAQFEMFITKYKAKEHNLQFPAWENWRCTATMARMAAMPASLDKAAKALSLDQEKDTKGAALIRKFSIPNSKGVRAQPTDDVESFNNFIQYCRQDVLTERAIHDKLSAFDLKDDTPMLRAYQFDTKLNMTGVPVNVKALENAQVIIDRYQTEYADCYRKLTNLNPTQTVKSLAWFRERGYPYKTMQAVNVDKALEHTNWCADKPEVHKALFYKKLSSYAAVAKVKKMLMCHVNGRVYGTHLFYGAGTGRWSGKIIQPQNFKRPSIEFTEEAYKAIQDGTPGQDIDVIFGNPLEVISSCIRHFIQLPNDNIIDADYAAIEARIVCWLAGQEDALQRFRNNIDSYVDMAAYVFNKSHSQVTKLERWLGKQTVLGCGFAMGKKKFYEQCVKLAEAFNITGLNVTKDLASKGVDAYRQKYDKVKNLWHECNLAAKNSIIYKGKTFRAGNLLSFTCVYSNGIPYMAMKLPSGRNIVYPFPAIEKMEKVFEYTCKHTGKEKKEKKTVDTITFYGQLPAKQTWGRVSTYGGKLVENATQAVAADIMQNGSVEATNQGFEIFMLVHDESLANAKSGTVDQFCKALCTLPSWAKGLPIEAEGETISFYKKT